MKTKDIRLFVTIGPFFQLNLGSDYFDSTGVEFINEREFKLNLKDNGLSRLIKKDMACELRINDKIFHQGIVEDVRALEGKMAATFLLDREVVLI